MVFFVKTSIRLYYYYYIVFLLQHQHMACAVLRCEDVQTNLHQIVATVPLAVAVQVYLRCHYSMKLIFRTAITLCFTIGSIRWWHRKTDRLSGRSRNGSGLLREGIGFSVVGEDE